MSLDDSLPSSSSSSTLISSLARVERIIKSKEKTLRWLFFIDGDQAWNGGLQSFEEKPFVSFFDASEIHILNFVGPSNASSSSIRSFFTRNSDKMTLVSPTWFSGLRHVKDIADSCLLAEAFRLDRKLRKLSKIHFVLVSSDNLISATCSLLSFEFHRSSFMITPKRHLAFWLLSSSSKFQIRYETWKRKREKNREEDEDEDDGKNFIDIFRRLLTSLPSPQQKSHITSEELSEKLLKALHPQSSSSSSSSFSSSSSSSSSASGISRRLFEYVIEELKCLKYEVPLDAFPSSSSSTIPSSSSSSPSPSTSTSFDSSSSPSSSSSSSSSPSSTVAPSLYKWQSDVNTTISSLLTNQPVVSTTQLTLELSRLNLLPPGLKLKKYCSDSKVLMDLNARFVDEGPGYLRSLSLPECAICTRHFLFHFQYGFCAKSHLDSLFALIIQQPNHELAQTAIGLHLPIDKKLKKRIGWKQLLADEYAKQLGLRSHVDLEKDQIIVSLLPSAPLPASFSTSPSTPSSTSSYSSTFLSASSSSRPLVSSVPLPSFLAPSAPSSSPSSSSSSPPGSPPSLLPTSMTPPRITSTTQFASPPKSPKEASTSLGFTRGVQVLYDGKRGQIIKHNGGTIANPRVQVQLEDNTLITPTVHYLQKLG